MTLGQNPYSCFLSYFISQNKLLCKTGTAFCKRDNSTRQTEKKRETDNVKKSIILKLDPYNYGGFCFLKMTDLNFYGGIPMSSDVYCALEKKQYLDWVS